MSDAIPESDATSAGHRGGAPGAGLAAVSSSRESRDAESARRWQARDTLPVQVRAFTHPPLITVIIPGQPFDMERLLPSEKYPVMARKPAPRVIIYAVVPLFSAALQMRYLVRKKRRPARTRLATNRL